MYTMGLVDNTLFTKKKDSHIIIVQIYVDDIIFGSTCQDLCDDFSKIMHDEFEMSMMGELNFFLGLQIKQLEDGIFFNQSKYVKEMLKKFGLENAKPIKTPMSSETKLTRDEEFLQVYIAQPPGLVDFKKPNHVFKLKKAIYGLQQAPKAWYDRLKAFRLGHKYTMGLVDNTLFTKKKDSHIIIVQIYVDDIIFGSTCQDLCDDFSKIMHDEFEMSMMGELNFYLSLQIKQLEDGIFFNQSKYVKEMLKKFGLEDAKPIKTSMSSETKLTRDEEGEPIDDTKYRGMIGSLLYLTTSRPDIMFSVCICARLQEAPKTSHLEAVKRIFRYIKGTSHLGLWYPKGTGLETTVYANFDHAGDYKQTALAISTTKAKYVSAGKACQQALWMKQTLVDYEVKLNDVPVLCDNKVAIDLSKNPILHSRTKHIEIRHHFLRDNVQKGNISIEKVASEDNIADILTKPLKREPFNLLRLGLGLMEPNT
ncbi:retrovirus-related pol polyprotein from transposon TNT 1-94 [Tanacetum coccineum]